MVVQAECQEIIKIKRLHLHHNLFYACLHTGRWKIKRKILNSGVAHRGDTVPLLCHVGHFAIMVWVPLERRITGNIILKNGHRVLPEQLHCILVDSICFCFFTRGLECHSSKRCLQHLLFILLYSTCDQTIWDVCTRPDTFFCYRSSVCHPGMIQASTTFLLQKINK